MFKKLEQRFVFISTLLFWEGQINAKNLMVKFNITRQSASALLKKYRDLHCNAVTYTVGSVHCRTGSFKYSEKVVVNFSDVHCHADI